MKIEYKLKQQQKNQMFINYTKKIVIFNFHKIVLTLYSCETYFKTKKSCK